MSLARKLASLLGTTGVIDTSVGGTPTGVALPFAGSAAPTGWLMCYGQAVSRTTYAALFTVIGTAFGAGDGSTTFNLPDLRGRTIAGKDNMGGAAASRLTTAAGGVDGATLGAAGGGQTHTLTTAQLPAHSHTGTAQSAGAHSHTVSAVDNSSGTDALMNDGETGQGTLSTSTAGAHTHTLSIANTGNGEAHPIVQPTLVLNAIIKT